MPQTLVELAGKLKRGQRLRIAHYDPKIPKENRCYSRSLTEAQILAYQERRIVSVERSKTNRKVLLVTVVHPEDYKYMRDSTI